jgi:hypothetical protein
VWDQKYKNAFLTKIVSIFFFELKQIWNEKKMSACACKMISSLSEEKQNATSKNDYFSVLENEVHWMQQKFVDLNQIFVEDFNGGHGPPHINTRQLENCWCKHFNEY